MHLVFRPMSHTAAGQFVGSLSFFVWIFLDLSRTKEASSADYDTDQLKAFRQICLQRDPLWSGHSDWRSDFLNASVATVCVTLPPPPLLVTVCQLSTKQKTDFKKKINCQLLLFWTYWVITQNCQIIMWNGIMSACFESSPPKKVIWFFFSPPEIISLLTSLFDHHYPVVI